MTRIKRDFLWVVGCWATLVVALMLSLFIIDAIDKASLICGILVGVGLVACIRMTTDFLDGVVSRDRETDE